MDMHGLISGPHHGLSTSLGRLGLILIILACLQILQTQVHRQDRRLECDYNEVVNTNYNDWDLTVFVLMERINI